MTRFEAIKNMTVDEMAEFFCKFDNGCDDCTCKNGKPPSCCESLLKRFRDYLQERI